jgi:hypothetical protein
MADSRAFAGAAEETAMACTRSLLRTAVASTHPLHLNDQLISCVARQQVSPESFQRSLARFALAHGAALAADTSRAAESFITGMAASTFLPVDEGESPTVAIEAHFARLAAVARGELTANELRRATSKRLNAAVADELSRAAGVWFDYLGTLDEQRGRFAEECLMTVLRSVDPVGFHGDVVEIAGPVNTTISTVVTLDAAGIDRAVLRCGVSDVRRADGVGPAFTPDVVLTPDEIVAERMHDAQMSLSLWLDEAIYERGSPYVGALHITRDGAPRLEIPLRITPR